MLIRNIKTLNLNYVPIFNFAAKKQKMETDYVRTRTFWIDLVVIAKTIPAVLFSKGAF